MENQAEILEEKRKRLLQHAKEAPESPGVYLMKARDGEILYVGKAKVLKNRLQSYFQNSSYPSLRIEILVGRIELFDVLLTQTEAEALILEDTLIKTHKPRFNVMLKDDKTYPYIKVDLSNQFPRLEWTRKVRADEGETRYFGPFPSGWAAKQVMRLLNETLLLRDCSDNTFSHRSRPCMLYQIGKCSAPCVKFVSEDEYKKTLQRAISILEGKDRTFTKELKKQMLEASEEENFELAARIRDQIKSIELVTALQTANEPGTDRNRDVLGIARSPDQPTRAQGVIVEIRAGKIMSVKHYRLENVDASLPDRDLVSTVITQHYLGVGKSRLFTDELDVLIPELLEDQEFLEGMMRLNLKEPRGEHDRQLMAIATTNAEHALEQAIRTETSHGIEALEEVMEKLHLQKLPHRMECFDISNIQGEDAVASRVVFVDGAPAKGLYRKYKIKTVIGSNDFAMMREVLGRRFSRSEGEDEFPDLLVVDGGKGQLAQAEAILQELNVQGVAAVGLAKARTEKNFQAKEVESSLERVFIPGRKNPVPLPQHTKAYRILTHLRDEAHRFAISYHRNLRDRNSF